MTHIEIGSGFRLIGRTNIFEAVRVYFVAGDIPAVVGETVIGRKRYRTVAHLADIVPVPAGCAPDGVPDEKTER